MLKRFLFGLLAALLVVSSTVSAPVYASSFLEVASGTAFPSNPVNRQRFFRTDRDILYFYDLTNTRWLSVAYVQTYVGVSDTLNPMTSGGTYRGVNPQFGQSTIIWQRATLWYFISGTANYTLVVAADKTGTTTTITTFSSFSTAGHNGVDSGAIDVSIDNTFPAVTGTLTRNSGTGTGYVLVMLQGRLLG